MFICRNELFDKFCEWEFKILFVLFSITPKSPYTRERCLMGYLAESLLPFFTFENKLRIKELPLAPMIGDKEEYSKQALSTKLKSRIFSLKNKEIFLFLKTY